MTTSKSGVWSYNHDCRINAQQLGAGNNWAMGYYGHGPTVRDAVLDAVRRQVELCDCVHGFLLFSSVAGGTGSGLGSYLVEALQDSFPSISTGCIVSNSAG